MATVVFYEKSGCIGNARQKRLLENAGHTLQVRNLLAENWTPSLLRPFFGDRPVSEWFNPTAPPIQQKQIVPEEVSAEQALALMTA